MMNYVQAVDDFLLYLEIEKNYSKNTIESYHFDLKCFHDFLNSHDRPSDLEQLNPSAVRRFIQDQVLHHGINPRTIQRRISSLKSFVQFCLKEGLTRNDFMAGVQAPKADKKLPVYKSLEELRKLFHFLETDSRPLSLRNHLLFKLLAFDIFFLYTNKLIEYLNQIAGGNGFLW